MWALLHGSPLTQSRRRLPFLLPTEVNPLRNSTTLWLPCQPDSLRRLPGPTRSMMPSHQGPPDEPDPVREATTRGSDDAGPTAPPPPRQRVLSMTPSPLSRVRDGVEDERTQHFVLLRLDRPGLVAVGTHAALRSRRRPGGGRFPSPPPARLNVEAELDDVAVPASRSPCPRCAPAGPSPPVHRTGGHPTRRRRSPALDEVSLLEVGVDHPGGLRCGVAPVGWSTRFLLARL